MAGLSFALAAALAPASALAASALASAYAQQISDFTNSLCRAALAAKDEAELQSIVRAANDNTHDMLQVVADYDRSWRQERDNVDAIRNRMAPYLNSSLALAALDRPTTETDIQNNAALAPLDAEMKQAELKLAKARGEYLKFLSASMALLEVQSIVADCAEASRLGFANTPRAPAGAVCEGGGGPLHCTGTFPGSYQLACVAGGPEKKEYGSGTVTFTGDGTAELRLRSPPPDLDPRPVRGTIDSIGHVQVIQTDALAEVTQKWTGDFSLQRGPDGMMRPAGGGSYESKVTDGGNEVYLSCVGSFKLSAGGLP